MARNVQINSRGPRPRSLREIERKRKLHKLYQHLAVLFLCSVLLGGAAVYVFLYRSHDITLAKEFDKADPAFGIQKVSLEHNRASSFASDLCVANEDISLEGVSLNAGASALFSEADDTTLYAKNIHERMYPASITKIMTALVAFKYGNMDEIVTVGEECKDIEMGSSVCEIKVGDKLTLRELVYGLMINSGNDAAMTIAVHVGGTVENFIDMMNKESKAIGATETHYTNPHGLQDEDHYTTVYDIYLTFLEALKYDDFLDIIGKASYYASFTNLTDEERNIIWESTNHYFINQATPPSFVTVVGGKTGTTSEAGACLALLSKDKYGDPYISIVLNASDKDTLYLEMNQLLSKINK